MGTLLRGATENDAAASWIAEVSVVQQLRSFFASMGNNSPFVDFDGQFDLPNHALGGDWGLAEHASKTSAKKKKHTRRRHCRRPKKHWQRQLRE